MLTIDPRLLLMFYWFVAVVLSNACIIPTIEIYLIFAAEQIIV